ncbi:hypothetical protein Vadar_027114 [Vaccinium darrowii]|uniref:Uncharacterized protein n=1 Tax=Vaccinium darrowii TaxID=229202 RepID=A0ACB7XUY2_9ERIC|nr:hypothetical protein Vadar_027114 [Vaccinium darrowii]
MQLRHPTAALLRDISATAKRVVAIHDYLTAYVVQDVATIPNAESYIFSPVSAFNMCFRVLKDYESSQLLEELKAPSSEEGNLTLEMLKLEGNFTPEMLKLAVDENIGLDWNLTLRFRSLSQCIVVPQLLNFLSRNK